LLKKEFLGITTFPASFDLTVAGESKIIYTGVDTPTMDNVVVGDLITIGTAFSANNQGTFTVVDSGTNFVKFVNAKATVDAGIVVSNVGGNVLQVHQASLKLHHYENTLPEDSFVISGSVLDVDLDNINQGTYTISKVLSRTRVVISEVMIAKPSTQLDSLFSQITVLEKEVYTGYKQIHNVTTNPANTARSLISLTSSGQINKINEGAGAVSMTAVSKLNFATTTSVGFDAYRFYTGLLAEVNKIVYGDPRDTITYPGVSAAGAEIFIEPPLVRRVEISINVRVKTGTPFSRIIERVRNNIASLINSSPIGEPIAISDIISTVNLIPGVQAVAISSPAYDATNDVIVVNASEKPLVLDIVNDITVSKID